VEASDTQVEVKLEEIRSCLDGDDEVDLWHLRELALTRGGFVSAQVRKRAWPKLMGVHQQVLFHASNAATANDTNADSLSKQKKQLVVEVSDRDYQLLQRDIPETIWNIQDHIHNNREEKKVTFLPGLLLEAATSSSPSSSPTTPNLVAVVLENENDDGCMSPLDTTPTTTPQPPRYFFATQNHRASTSRLQEQRALQSTLVSLLRTTPPPPAEHDNHHHHEEQRYHYYHGLADLTALLLINLESPSLSLMILKKLASYHLRDAMRGDDDDDDDSLKTPVECIFRALFQKVNVTLYHHYLEQQEQDDPIISWIAPWFASHVTNVSAASRLLDVFLVSHATMPIYMAVALLVCRKHQEQLLQTTTCSSNLDKELRNGNNNLPHDLVQEEETLEDVIALALQYM
jgi:hypothetical protein